MWVDSETGKKKNQSLRRALLAPPQRLMEG